ncbi:MAG: alpha-L-fucosidase, partial [Planctomycetota bacterium]
MSSRSEWFENARFGMFIHWGLYSLLARGEWVRNRERIPFDEYRKLTGRFRASRCDVRSWAALARGAGMKYMVLTTKHHDGFCLFRTRTTDFNSINTPARRDFVGEFVRAARAEGLKVGLYFSMMDWSHPLCLPDRRLYYWDCEELERFGFTNAMKSDPRFLSYLKTQITELLTQYGKIDILWHDGTWAYDARGWRIEELNRHARRLQPHILFTDRAHCKSDIASCEQEIKPKKGAWEACMTLNDHWGYCVGDNNWKSPYQVVHTLLTIAERRGCLLLNIGPRGDGSVPGPSVRILEAVGRWTHAYPQALYRIDRTPFGWSHIFFSTVSGTNLYLHMKAYPRGEAVFAGLASPVKAVELLPGGRRLPFTQ